LQGFLVSHHIRGDTAVSNETKRPEDQRSEKENGEASSAGKSKLAFSFGKTAKYWLAFLLVSTLVIHGVFFALYKTSKTAAPIEYTPEIGIGKYEFTADKTSGGRIANVEFSLFITALDGLEQIARNRLISHKFRVQEEIESLMREAHSGDFEDTTLNDLKRQIRERIDHALGNRVVSNVIVTNLKITTSNDKVSATDAKKVSSLPWMEKSSGYVSQQDSN
jgi:flagellar basal body-associated protein FliL